MDETETYKIHRTIIYSLVVVFEFLGLFGNLNIIVLTLRKRSLRSNFGLILCSLASIHSLCLLYELVDMGFGIAVTFYSYDIRRRACFFSLFPYVFLHSLQTGTIWILSLDLLLSISLPFRYRKFDRHTYFALLFSPAVAYGTLIVAFGFSFLDDQDILMCNPPSSLVPPANSLYYFIMSLFSILTVVFYTASFVLIYVKSRNHSAYINLLEKKALRTLKVLIVVFVVSRVFSTFLSTTLLTIGVRRELIQLVQNYNVIPNLICYSQNAYVCYFRSTEYRSLLREQLTMVFGSSTDSRRFWKPLQERRRVKVTGVSVVTI